MKRRITIIAVFVLAGAVINVAVAWLLFAHHFHGGAAARSQTNAFNWTSGDWPFRPPVGWPQSPIVSELRAVGYSDTEARNAAHPFDATRCMILTQSGWPMLALQSRWLYSLPNEEGWTERGTFAARYDYGIYAPAWMFRIKSADSVLMPVRLNWPGFAVNSVLYGGALWSLTLGPFTLRRMLRKQRGGCVTCGYDLTGNTSGRCPECGAAIGA